MTDADYYGKLIHGVEVHPLRVFSDERGAVMRMMRRDDPAAQEFHFGEIYFSAVHPHMVKAWHLHRYMTLHYSCVAGRVQLALFDDREDSPTRGMVNTLHLEGWPDFKDYILVRIPPFVWNGFRSVPRQIESAGGGFNAVIGEAIIANCADLPHDPEEIERMAPEDFPLNYDWGPYLVAG